MYLEEKLKSYYDEETVSEIINGLVSKKTTFRINRLKTTIVEIEEFLNNNNISYSKVDYFEDAFILENDEDVKSWDIYQEGKIYLQSLSSMLPPIYLEASKGESVLDMAAAPGGKTSEIASLSNDEALITAVEKNKLRGEKLKYNLDKQGVKHASILFEDATNLNEYMKFNKVLLDAPCSGSGTSTREDEMKLVTEELVNRSASIQTKLLNKAIDVVNVGDIIVYSTCSVFKVENEEVINKYIKEGRVEVVPIKLDEVETLPSTIEGVITVKPSNLYEGFFVSKLKKLK